ncbi:MAG: UPF0149 family protein [Gammaproteobacteria bacterium]
MVYQTIDKILIEQGADVSAAEAHGIATGMLCVDIAATSENWLSELFFDALPQGEDLAVLTDLFEKTGRLLDSDEYGFDLLLPDDDEDLEVRVEALRCWCQGFLFGMGYAYGNEGDDASLKGGSHWPGDTGEILRDIVEFTKMDAPENSPFSEEEDAVAFTEINEYLRVAVYTIRNEFKKYTDRNLH